MSSNILLKLVAVFVVLGLITVLIVGKGERKKQSGAAPGGSLVAVETGPADKFNGLDIGIMNEEVIQAEYGVDVDSPVETMRTLTNETRAVRKENEIIVDENKELKTQVDKLLKMEEAMNKRLLQQAQNIEQNQGEKITSLEKVIKRYQENLDQVKSSVEEIANVEPEAVGSKKTAGGFVIGEAGIPEGLGYDETTGEQVNYDEVVWINPVDAKIDPRDPGTLSLPKFSEFSNPVSESAQMLPGKKEQTKEERMVRAYTIPSNATLLGSVSMTAMLGRIPIGGRVQDPYPFKLIVGEENLSSNGIKIPNVTGIKMSGIAKGDWTLSCTSGEIYSMTFTFRDGTIQTIPEPGTKATEALAWFSDVNGIPCITGKRITNAVSYLGSRIGLAAASSYAKARADGELTNTTSTGVGGTSSSSTLTGDPMVYAKNTAIGDGIDEVSDWLDDRQANSFDAIYVPPGTPLAIHVTTELKIDYDPEGRKVNHYADIKARSSTHLD
ncbi:hypothetical protein DOK_11796 [gamma proteobacterium BDW918]|nr:hypothetical protein DOK_11796 [gamma proteobacterium BDW918]